MIEIDKVAFAFICVLASIGALILLFIFVYIVAGVLDLTWHDRHKHYHPTEDEKNCPYEIEDKNDDKRK